VNKEYHYKLTLAKSLESNPDQIFCYWKGRVALYTALKAIGVKEKDEVILPAFTCVVVPNAIIYLGAKPVYVDIDKESLNTTLSNIQAATTVKTKCILIQNTFGLSSEVDEIVAFAKSKGIVTIEDCTHGFGGTYRNRPNGVRSDFAFFSTQWNKPFSTGVGGFLLVNNLDYLKSVNEVNKLLIKPGFKKSIILKMLISFKKAFLGDRTYWFFLKLYRFLSKMGLVVGSSSGSEISSTVMDDNYFMGATKVQFSEGLRALNHLDELMLLRKKNAAIYSSFLKSNGKIYVKEIFNENHSFLKYPILIKDRVSFLAKAEKASVRLGDWFLSPIHPVESEFEKWFLDPENFPNAAYVSKHVLNLPTEIENPEKVLVFLTQNINDIL
jgi:dTDP-4-amino-4,6-dideoxygalactose transaminase